MSALREIIKPGTVTLLTGAPSSFQEPVAIEAACRAARSGREVVVLCDGSGAKASIVDHLIAWRRHKAVLVGERMAVHAFNERALDREQDFGAAVLRAFRKEGWRPSVVVTTALARDPGGFNGYAAGRWVEMATALAKTGTAVLLAGHGGPLGKDEPPEVERRGDIWQCVAGRALAATLLGPDGARIELRGRDLGGPGISKSLAFDDVEAAEAVVS